MPSTNVNRSLRFPLLSAVTVCCALLVACVGGSSPSVAGIIVKHTGEPFAGKDIVLVRLLPGDKVTVAARRVGGLMELEVPLVELATTMNPGDRILYDTDRMGAARWKATTKDDGSFLVRNVEPGRFVMLWMVAGGLYEIGTDEGHIRIAVQEGQTSDLGTITLLSSSEPIVK